MPDLVLLAEILEEALDVVEEELVIRREDEVDDVARLRVRLEIRPSGCDGGEATVPTPQS